MATTNNVHIYVMEYDNNLIGTAKSVDKLTAESTDITKN